MEENVKPIKCENCEDSPMYYYGKQDSQYYYFMCKKCKTERLIPKKEVKVKDDP